MAATIVERMTRNGDWETDGGLIDVPAIECALTLYSEGLVDAAWIKSFWGTTSSAQNTQVDTLLGTMPLALLTAVNAAARARWPAKIAYIAFAGCQQFTNFATASACATAMGV